MLNIMLNVNSIWNRLGNSLLRDIVVPLLAIIFVYLLWQYNASRLGEPPKIRPSPKKEKYGSKCRERSESSTIYIIAYHYWSLETRAFQLSHYYPTCNRSVVDETYSIPSIPRRRIPVRSLQFSYAGPLTYRVDSVTMAIRSMDCDEWIEVRISLDANVGFDRCYRSTRNTSRTNVFAAIVFGREERESSVYCLKIQD